MHATNLERLSPSPRDFSAWRSVRVAAGAPTPHRHHRFFVAASSHWILPHMVKRMIGSHAFLDTVLTGYLTPIADRNTW